MGRKIVLYRNCRILEDKNMQVDSLKDYLNTLQTKVYPNAVQTAEPQIIKNINDIDLTIKVDIDQEDYLKRSVHNQYNYAMITIDDNSAQTNAYYYFIRKINWKSQKCAELELHMDILNTYHGEYKLTKKTNILREHQDRWEYEEKLPDIAEAQSIDYTLVPNDWRVVQVGSVTQYVSLPIATTPNLNKQSESMNPAEFYLGSVRVTIANVVCTYTPSGTVRFVITANGVHSASDIPTITFTVNYNSSAKYLQAKVDSIPEDFGDIAKVLKTNNNIYEDDNYTDRRWYLVYRTPDSPTAASPVDCFLVPNFNYKIGTVGSNTVTLDKDYFAPGYTYYFTNKDNMGGIVSCTFDNVTRYLDDTYLTSSRYLAFCIHRSSNTGKLSASAIQYGSGNTNPGYMSVIQAFTANETDSVTFNNIYYMRTNNGETPHDVDVDFDKIQNDYERTIVNDAVGADVYSHTIDDNYFDRTDSRMIKIIELPYAPIDLTDTSKYTIDTASRTIKLNYKSELINNFKDVDLNTYVPYLNQVASYQYLYTANRFLKDPKLLHSSTTQVKFMYDNYAKEYALENCNKNVYSLTTTPKTYKTAVYYKQANTITSSLAFKFEAYEFNEKAESDYCDYLISTRNNELPLYHNAYLDYMRTDYNYAKKAQQLQTTNNIVNTAVAGVGGAIAGAQSGGVAGAIVGGITGTAKGLQNTITSYISSSNAIEQAQLKARMQATGVSGSDDLNLFNFYGNNRLSIRVYQPKDYILDKIDDLYYYCGYKCFKQAIPNTTSRFWFNYIQCEPVYDTDSTKAKITKECLDELTRKYLEGVTVYHMNTISGEKKWDLTQSRENWELDLVN